ncbi:MAG: Ldh family oxidoreductase [Candidatus Aenigmarchaeota archaeon]|nr:Ldh family oxidoreductase [Candidatus Aenigmarchaeota archaeon]
MKVKIDEMTKLMKNVLAKNGLSKREAELLVEDYVLGELEGKKSHGMMAFPSFVEKIPKTKRGKIVIEKEGISFALLNCNQEFGQIAAEEARKILVKKAKANGIAMVGAYNMRAFLRPGTQAEKIEKEGMIGIVVNNGGLGSIAPTGSIDPILGTNPVGLAIPTKENPITGDFATSKRAWGEVRVAKAEGRKLPENTFMDKEGNFTTEPDKAESVVPFGDYKGYILALFIEILTGSLVNMPMGVNPEDSGQGSLRFLTKKGDMRGAIFIAIDPSKFTDFKRFKAANTKLLAQIKSSRKARDVREILIPGERSLKNKNKARSQGYFEIDKDLYEKIKNL